METSVLLSDRKDYRKYYAKWQDACYSLCGSGIRDEEFLEWLKNILPKNRYSILSDESVQRALTESVIPAYMRHLKGHYEKESSRNPEFADPFVISYALSVKRRSLLDVIVVSDDDNLCRICSVLKIPCFKWRDFFNHLNTDC